MSNKITLSDQLNSLKIVITFLNKYKIILYLFFILSLYGYLILAINNLESGNTTITTNSSPTINTTQHINQSVVKQLEQLQNNNVTVQSLFQQARNNPF